LGSEDLGQLVISCGRSAAELTDTCRRRVEHDLGVADRADRAIVKGTKTSSAVLRASFAIVSRRSCVAVMSRTELVGALAS